MKRLLLYIGAVLLGACQMSTEPLNEPASFQAVVEAIQLEGSGKATMTVGQIQSISTEIPIGVSIIYITDGTKLFAGSTSNLQPASLATIQVGKQVRIWADAELRSSPPEYVAAQIVVND